MRHSNDKEIIRLGEMFFHKLRRRLLAAKNHEDELRSAIYEGILRAYQTYDPTKSGFSTYAFNWALAYARKAIKEAVETVHVPDYHRNAWHSTASLNQPFEHEGSETCLQDFVSVDTREFESIENRLTLEQILAKAEQVEIDWCRENPEKCTRHSAVEFWVRLQQGATLEQIAASAGVSREYVRQLSNRGHVYIQGALGANKKAMVNSLRVIRKAESTPRQRDFDGTEKVLPRPTPLAAHQIPSIRFFENRKPEQLSLAF